MDGHGDLRPQHIFLTSKPVIIDCLEFNQDLRRQDPADEIAFLAMECERLGQREAARKILSVYFLASGDRPQQELLYFYASFRALHRARIKILNLEYTTSHPLRKILSDIHSYLKISLGFARELGNMLSLRNS
ncbi:hypothetical protein [Emcibacter sp.]|uniref:hypothetical protein n=1 Tax=Emcibacter sp. TaxID=1979954 RepID=UPI002AA66ABF|nr:hypothetical protein [Emcibacter sp.]